MKYLLSALFVLTLFCGITSQAHASNFHVGVVDPTTCDTANPSICLIADPTGSISGFQFTTAICNSGVPTSGGTPFCLELINGTLNQTINSIVLDISSAALGGQTPMCDTTAAFTGSCTPQPDGSELFTFTGVPGQPFGPGVVEDIYVAGLTNSAALTDGPGGGVTIEVAATPEPDSLLLFGTGAMMAGLYLTKRPLLSAFGKK